MPTRNSASAADTAPPPGPPLRQPAGRGPGSGHLRTAWSAISRRLATRFLSWDRQVLLGCGPPRDTTVAMLGAVAVRRSRDSLMVQTTVKGEAGVALGTGLRRLAPYVRGDNRERRVMVAVAPIIQRAGTPGTWTVQIGLAYADAASGAPSPRSGKVRLVHAPGETFAVMRVPGRPSPAACGRGESAIRAALDGTGWVASGRAMIRLPCAFGLLRWTDYFEVAIPVAALPQ